jgi:hypothetical protein
LKRFHARLFQAIDWSTERVRRQTVARAAELGVEVAMLAEWYDVDDAEALALLGRELLQGCGPYRGGFAAPHTSGFVRRLAAGNRSLPD